MIRRFAQPSSRRGHVTIRISAGTRPFRWPNCVRLSEDQWRTIRSPLLAALEMEHSDREPRPPVAVFTAHAVYARNGVDSATVAVWLGVGKPPMTGAKSGINALIHQDFVRTPNAVPT